MDLIDLMKFLGVAISTFIVYRLMVHERKDKTKGHYTRPAWNFFLKKFYATFMVKQKQKRDKQLIDRDTHKYESEAPKVLQNEESSDSQMICGNDMEGNSLLIKFTRRRHRVAEVWLLLRLKNGQVYIFPGHPNTKIVNATPNIFEGSGLKLECFVPYSKWRITYSGMLRRGISQEMTESEDDLYFVRFNFMWATASDPTWWPQDWSPKLIATSLATEKWRDGKWMQLMIKKDFGGYDQYGSCHGQVKIYENDSAAYVEGLAPKVETMDLNLPGLRQRRWGPHGPHKNQNLHRTGVLIGTIKDGCAFEIGAFSGKYGLTHTQFGNVRFPNGRVLPIDSSDFNLAALGEYQNHLPEATTLQIRAGSKPFVVVVSFKNKEKMPLYGGSQNDSWNAFIIPIDIKFNAVQGSGFAMFWYPKNLREFDIQEIPTKIKRIFNRTDVPLPDKLVISFADKEAQSVSVAGGKGSSVAILRVIQETKGEDFLDKRDRSQQILNALVDQVSTNPLQRSIRVQTLLENGVSKTEKQRAGSIAKIIFPDPHDFDMPDFYVPQGFIVSVSAIEQHLRNHQAIKTHLENLEDVAYERTAGDIKEFCTKVQKAFEASKLDEHLKKLIAEKLDVINFDGSARFAVRSSGVTEDSEESSAAGQNETFLGLKANEDVFEAVVKCWASLYSFQSVHYRKQHIQPVITSMAVVVQKMVEADSAGVLFSRHPLNGDPGVMIITANFGLGESVVSGSAEPDTFYVKRSHKDEVTILGSKAGAKKMLIQMDDGTSTKEVELNEDKRNQLCLKVGIVLKLAKLGVIMEKFFGTPRDIEFAVTKDNKIYLLQSRPITALNNLTEDELIHENDTAVMSDTDLTSKANVGEVVLGAASTFFYYSLMKRFDKLVFEDIHKGEEFLGLKSFAFAYSHQHLLMTVNPLFLANVIKKVAIMDRVMSLAIFGSDIYEKYPEVFEIATHRNAIISEKMPSILLMMYDVIFNIDQYAVIMEETSDKIKRQFSIENLKKLTTAEDIWDHIERGMDDLEIVSKCHSRATNNSLMFQMFAFVALVGKNEKLSTDHYRDIGLILGTISDVESANVPEMIKEIAGMIAMEGKQEGFLNIDSKLAADWLKENCSSAFELHKSFMHRHGHRSINELDFIAKPWSMEPEKIAEMIKSNLSFASSGATATSKILTSSEIIENLKTPLGFVAKFILGKLLPKCQKGVQRREYAKSKLVHGVNDIRKALYYLEELLVKDGLLPQHDLIFHFSPFEIKNLMANRDGQLVAKVIRRQKLHAKLSELKFPELNFGIPRPMSEYQRGDQIVEKGDTLVRGTPVCGGVVTGIACVCRSFADVGKIQKGDILVTYGTDIGWSPYFPILGGVCTEIGGLISHGAVVAREYGLPCIVGATSATDKIQHGQMIVLNADNGTITAAS